MAASIELLAASKSRLQASLRVYSINGTDLVEGYPGGEDPQVDGATKVNQLQRRRRKLKDRGIYFTRQGIAVFAKIVKD